MPVADKDAATHGCPTRLSKQSFNKASPFSPALGLIGAVFALAYAPGPEKKPWDKVMGYPMVHGRMDVHNVHLANFGGDGACGGVGAYALASHDKVCNRSRNISGDVWHGCTTRQAL